MSEPVTPALSLRDHIAAETAPVAVVPETAPVAPVTATPEDEANSPKPDAELSDAARTLRNSRLDQRKAKLRQEVTELNELLRQRKELRAHLAEAPRETPAAPASRPAPVTDPRDPEPTFESFSAANPTHPDPYAGFVRAQAAWDRRQEQRQASVTQQQTRAEQDWSARVAEYHQRAEAARQKFSDFDVVTSEFFDRHSNHPHSQAIAAALGSADASAEVAYHLATHPQDASRIFALDPVRIALEIGKLSAVFTAPPKETLKPQTTAPAPPSQTVGAGVTASADDPNTRSFKDHIRIENTRERERRIAGSR